MAIVEIGGKQLFYTRPQRRPGAPALLLLHGAGGSHLAWPRAIQRLAGMDIYNLDLPGHGRSAGGGDAIESFGAAVAGFAHTLNLQQVCVTGHSMGGAIALWLALQKPSWLTSLVLIGSGARLRVSPQILTGLEAEPDETVDLIMHHAWHEESPWAEPAAEAMRGVGADTLRRSFLACDDFDVRDRLADIDLPALIICGTEDRMTPPALSRELAASLPRASLRLVEDAGHYVTLERPLAVADAIVAFLDSLGSKYGD